MLCAGRYHTSAYCGYNNLMTFSLLKHFSLLIIPAGIDPAGMIFYLNGSAIVCIHKIYIAYIEIIW